MDIYAFCGRIDNLKFVEKEIRGSPIDIKLLHLLVRNSAVVAIFDGKLTQEDILILDTIMQSHQTKSDSYLSPFTNEWK